MGKANLSCLKRNVHLLRAIEKGSKNRKKNIVCNADDDLCRALCECAANIIYENVPIADWRKEKLSHHKRLLRDLANPKLPISKKREAIQSGGFISLLPSLIAPVLSLLGSVLNPA